MRRRVSMPSSGEAGRGSRLRNITQPMASRVKPSGTRSQSNAFMCQGYDAQKTRSPQVSQCTRTFPLRTCTRSPGDFTAAQGRYSVHGRQCAGGKNFPSLWTNLGTSWGPPALNVWSSTGQRCGWPWDNRLKPLQCGGFPSTPCAERKVTGVSSPFTFRPPWPGRSAPARSGQGGSAALSPQTTAGPRTRR